MSGELKVFDGITWKLVMGPTGETGIQGVGSQGINGVQGITGANGIVISNASYNSVTITGDNDG